MTIPPPHLRAGVADHPITVATVVLRGVVLGSKTTPEGLNAFLGAPCLHAQRKTHPENG